MTRKVAVLMTVKAKIDKADLSLLSKVTDTSFDDNVFNIRKNGKLLVRNITENVSIVSKEDNSGIDIYVKENTKNALIMIPVIVTESGLNDKVYNDFHIGANSKVNIIAGCAIHNEDSKKTGHEGIHRFFIEENADVNYIEKHYGEGHGKGHKTLDPITEIQMKPFSKMHIDTVQIEGVDSSTRITKAFLEDNATLTISEKIMTSLNQFAKTDFEINLDGENSSSHVTSRSVATGNSKQTFISKVNGNNKSFCHVECDGILKENGTVEANPQISANHLEANLIHEATIGKIAGDQLLKLMSLGLSSDEAEKEIINGFLK